MAAWPAALGGFDALTAEWFARQFGAPTEPQALGCPRIRAGRDVLIWAPTGSGKTLAAFLISLDGLVRAARGGTLPEATGTVYVSPLKALSNDIHQNLDVPLAGIRKLAASQGIELAGIRTALRTGDTPAWERQQLAKTPPHILVTTPESLFILMTAARPRETLRGVHTVIVDEIHAVADDKRGAHLALTLARLDALVEASGGRRPQRIGLSATLEPVGEVARFLSDSAEIVEVGRRREMDLAVEVPREELGPVASNELWDRVYDRLAELIRAHRTTLVFVNTRRLAERVAHHLGERLGPGTVLPHHGSLARRLRLEAESRLKAGELRAVVATASLELGIDIGTVELVCQIGSPRAIATALQRIGRSGHWKGATPKGRLFATTRDELLECAALVRAMRAGEMDCLSIPRAPLDILAQQLVAACAAEDRDEDALFAMVRRAYPYRGLERSDFDAVVDMLAEGIATNRGRSGAYLHRDLVNRRLRARRGARLAAITGGGAIPDTANFAVVVEPEGTVIGTVDEDFATESMAGDTFLLGTNSWRIRRIGQGRVRVVDAHGAPPSIPFWRGEAPGRTRELSAAFARLRGELAEGCLPGDCGLDAPAAEQARAYAAAGRAALGVAPASGVVVAERFFDEAGGMQLVLHAPFGSRINRAWGLALRKRFCRTFNFELQAAATDNGIVISLGEQHAFPLEVVFEFLNPENVEHVLTLAMLDSPMFTARWRWNASRALAIPRFRGGARVPAPIQRMRADDLLAAVFPDQAACAENLTGEVRIPEHPLVAETISNCLHEAMDVEGLKEVLRAIREGRIRTVAIDTSEPSPFSHEILNANPYAYLDDAPLEERRARAVALRGTLRTDFSGGVGVLDAAAIRRVAEEAAPVVRDPEELHEALLTLVTLPPAVEWEGYFGELAGQRRAAAWETAGRRFWVAAERLELARAVHPEGRLEPEIAAVSTPRGVPDTREACAAEILRGWFESGGPVTAAELSGRLAIEGWLVEAALARLEGEGQILRGRFTPGREGALEWCHRRLLARIHRLTIARLRSEIEPAGAAVFERYQARWQHTAPGTQLHGVDGTLAVIRQLQGFEFPAAAWETEVLPGRVARYTPEYLDRLCLAGEVMWGRLSPHPAFEDGGGERRHRVRPTRVAPLAIFRREDAGWLLARGASGEPPLSHPAAELLAALRQRGASFFPDLARATGRLASEVEDGLWELVAAGLVTADGFENLRALLDPKRRRGEGRGRRARPRHAAGRWALLRDAAPEAGSTADDFARQLLARWGVVFRDLLVHETLAPPWRVLLGVLRGMEARGEIRGGRFVAGFAGEQFAQPEALDLLRAVRRQ